MIPKENLNKMFNDINTPRSVKIARAVRGKFIDLKENLHPAYIKYNIQNAKTKLEIQAQRRLAATALVGTVRLKTALPLKTSSLSLEAKHSVKPILSDALK